MNGLIPLQHASDEPEWIEGNHCFKCALRFTLIKRPSHCRNCGHIFCKLHCSQSICIPHKYLNGVHKVCDDCQNRFRQLEESMMSKQGGIYSYPNILSGTCRVHNATYTAGVTQYMVSADGKRLPFHSVLPKPPPNVTPSPKPPKTPTHSQQPPSQTYYPHSGSATTQITPSKPGSTTPLMLPPQSLTNHRTTPAQAPPMQCNTYDDSIIPFELKNPSRNTSIEDRESDMAVVELDLDTVLSSQETSRAYQPHSRASIALPSGYVMGHANYFDFIASNMSNISSPEFSRFSPGLNPTGSPSFQSLPRGAATPHTCGTAPPIYETTGPGVPPRPQTSVGNHTPPITSTKHSMVAFSRGDTALMKPSQATVRSVQHTQPRLSTSTFSTNTHALKRQLSNQSRPTTLSSHGSSHFSSIPNNLSEPSESNDNVGHNVKSQVHYGLPILLDKGLIPAQFHLSQGNMTAPGGNTCALSSQGSWATSNQNSENSDKNDPKPLTAHCILPESLLNILVHALWEAEKKHIDTFFKRIVPSLSLSSPGATDDRTKQIKSSLLDASEIKNVNYHNPSNMNEHPFRLSPEVSVSYLIRTLLSPFSLSPVQQEFRAIFFLFHKQFITSSSLCSLLLALYLQPPLSFPNDRLYFHSKLTILYTVAQWLQLHYEDVFFVTPFIAYIYNQHVLSLQQQLIASNNNLIMNGGGFKDDQTLQHQNQNQSNELYNQHNNIFSDDTIYKQLINRSYNASTAMQYKTLEQQIILTRTNLLKLYEQSKQLFYANHIKPYIDTISTSSQYLQYHLMNKTIYQQQVFSSPPPTTLMNPTISPPTAVPASPSSHFSPSDTVSIAPTMEQILDLTTTQQYIAQSAQHSHLQSLFDSTQLPSSLIPLTSPPLFTHIISPNFVNLQSYTPITASLWAHSPASIANILTLRNAALFSTIRLRDCVQQAWIRHPHLVNERMNAAIAQKWNKTPQPLFKLISSSLTSNITPDATADPSAGIQLFNFDLEGYEKGEFIPAQNSLLLLAEEFNRISSWTTASILQAGLKYQLHDEYTRFLQFKSQCKLFELMLPPQPPTTALYTATTTLPPSLPANPTSSKHGTLKSLTFGGSNAPSTRQFSATPVLPSKAHPSIALPISPLSLTEVSIQQTPVPTAPPQNVHLSLVGKKLNAQVITLTTGEPEITHFTHGHVSTGATVSNSDLPESFKGGNFTKQRKQFQTMLLPNNICDDISEEELLSYARSRGFLLDDEERRKLLEHLAAHNIDHQQKLQQYEHECAIYELEQQHNNRYFAAKAALGGTEAISVRNNSSTSESINTANNNPINTLLQVNSNIPHTPTSSHVPTPAMDTELKVATLPEDELSLSATHRHTPTLSVQSNFDQVSFSPMLNTVEIAELVHPMASSNLPFSQNAKTAPTTPSNNANTPHFSNHNGIIPQKQNRAPKPPQFQQPILLYTQSSKNRTILSISPEPLKKPSPPGENDSENDVSDSGNNKFRPVIPFEQSTAVIIIRNFLHMCDHLYHHFDFFTLGAIVNGLLHTTIQQLPHFDHIITKEPQYSEIYVRCRDAVANSSNFHTYRTLWAKAVNKHLLAVSNEPTVDYEVSMNTLISHPQSLPLKNTISPSNSPLSSRPESSSGTLPPLLPLSALPTTSNNATPVKKESITSPSKRRQSTFQALRSFMSSGKIDKDDETGPPTLGGIDEISDKSEMPNPNIQQNAFLIQSSSISAPLPVQPITTPTAGGNPPMTKAQRNSMYIGLLKVITKSFHFNKAHFEFDSNIEHKPPLLPYLDPSGTLAESETAQNKQHLETYLNLSSLLLSQHPVLMARKVIDIGVNTTGTGLGISHTIDRVVKKAVFSQSSRPASFCRLAHPLFALPRVANTCEFQFLFQHYLTVKKNRILKELRKKDEKMCTNKKAFISNTPTKPPATSSRPPSLPKVTSPSITKPVFKQIPLPLLPCVMKDLFMLQDNKQLFVPSEPSTANIINTPIDLLDIFVSSTSSSAIPSVASNHSNNLSGPPPFGKSCRLLGSPLPPPPPPPSVPTTTSAASNDPPDSTPSPSSTTNTTSSDKLLSSMDFFDSLDSSDDLLTTPSRTRSRAFINTAAKEHLQRQNGQRFSTVGDTSSFFGAISTGSHLNSNPLYNTALSTPTPPPFPLTTHNSPNIKSALAQSVLSSSQISLSTDPSTPKLTPLSMQLQVQGTDDPKSITSARFVAELSRKISYNKLQQQWLAMQAICIAIHSSYLHNIGVPCVNDLSNLSIFISPSETAIGSRDTDASMAGGDSGNGTGKDGDDNIVQSSSYIFPYNHFLQDTIVADIASNAQKHTSADESIVFKQIQAGELQLAGNKPNGTHTINSSTEKQPQLSTTSPTPNTPGCGPVKLNPHHIITNLLTAPQNVGASGPGDISQWLYVFHNETSIKNKKLPPLSLSALQQTQYKTLLNNEHLSYQPPLVLASAINPPLIGPSQLFQTQITKEINSQQQPTSQPTFYDTYGSYTLLESAQSNSLDHLGESLYNTLLYHNQHFLSLRIPIPQTINMYKSLPLPPFPTPLPSNFMASRFVQHCLHEINSDVEFTLPRAMAPIFHVDGSPVSSPLHSPTLISDQITSTGSNLDNFEHKDKNVTLPPAKNPLYPIVLSPQQISLLDKPQQKDYISWISNQTALTLFKSPLQLPWYHQYLIHFNAAAKIYISSLSRLSNHPTPHNPAQSTNLSSLPKLTISSERLSTFYSHTANLSAQPQPFLPDVILHNVSIPYPLLKIIMSLRLITSNLINNANLSAILTGKGADAKLHSVVEHNSSGIIVPINTNGFKLHEMALPTEVGVMIKSSLQRQFSGFVHPDWDIVLHHSAALHAHNSDNERTISSHDQLLIDPLCSSTDDNKPAVVTTLPSSLRPQVSLPIAPPQNITHKNDFHKLNLQSPLPTYPQPVSLLLSELLYILPPSLYPTLFHVLPPYICDRWCHLSLWQSLLSTPRDEEWCWAIYQALSPQDESDALKSMKAFESDRTQLLLSTLVAKIKTSDKLMFDYALDTVGDHEILEAIRSNDIVKLTAI